MPLLTSSRSIAAAVLGFAVVAGFGISVRAGDYCPPPPCGHYERVSVTRCVEVPFTRIVTLYDHCGRPFEVEKTGIRTVEVLSRRWVFVRD